MTRQGGIDRVEASKRIMRTVSQLPPDRLPHLYHAPDGSVPVIVVLPHEHASEVIGRVNSIGGGANVAVAFAKYFELLPLLPNGTADAQIIINQDLSMGMLLLRIEQNPGKVIQIKLRDREVELAPGNLELAYA